MIAGASLGSASAPARRIRGVCPFARRPEDAGGDFHCYSRCVRREQLLETPDRVALLERRFAFLSTFVFAIDLIEFRESSLDTHILRNSWTTSRSPPARQHGSHHLQSRLLFGPIDSHPLPQPPESHPAHPKFYWRPVVPTLLENGRPLGLPSFRSRPSSPSDLGPAQLSGREVSEPGCVVAAPSSPARMVFASAQHHVRQSGHAQLSGRGGRLRSAARPTDCPPHAPLRHHRSRIRRASPP